MTMTIAISNQKGGVAKTTTCLSLGGALAEMGKSVLLVDLDPQANLTISLGLDSKKLRHTVLDCLMGNHSLVGVSRESAIFAMDIVPANYELALIDKVLYKRKNYQYRLRQALDQIPQGLYDFVLLDCPPSLAPLTLNALTAADLLIIPAQCEFYAAYSLRQTIGLALQIRTQSNPDLIYRVLITMHDMRNKIHRMILDEMRQGLKSVLLDTVIQVDTKLRESPAFGKPITSYAPRSRASRQYRELAEELCAMVGRALPGRTQLPLAQELALKNPMAAAAESRPAQLIEENHVR